MDAMKAFYKSIEDLLSEVGLRHEKDEHSEKDQRHSIYEITSGRLIGRYDAHDALRIIRVYEDNPNKVIDEKLLATYNL